MTRAQPRGQRHYVMTVVMIRQQITCSIQDTLKRLALAVCDDKLAMPFPCNALASVLAS